jgi:hypothetical protein
MALVQPTVISSEALGADIYSSQQQALNLRLRLDVDDALGAVKGMHRNLDELLSDWQARWRAAKQHTAKGMALLDAELVCVETQGCTADDVTASARLQLDPEFHARYNKYGAYVLKAPAPTNPEAREQQRAEQEAEDAYLGSDDDDDDDDGQAAAAGASAAIIAALLDELHSAETRLSRRMVIRAQLDDTHWARFPLAAAPLPDAPEDAASGHTSPAASRASSKMSVRPSKNSKLLVAPRLVAELHAVNRLELADPLILVRAELAKNHRGLAALEAQVRLTLDERDACLRAENISAAELRAATISDTFSGILEQVLLRCEMVDAAEGDLRDYHAELARSKAVEQTAELLANDTVNLLRKAEEDIDELAKWREGDCKATAEAAKAAAAAAAELRAKMDRNEAEQRAAWEEIARQQGKLAHLNGAHAGLVEQQAADVQAERERAKQADAVTAAHERQKATLDAVKQNLDQALKFTDASKAFASAAYGGIAEKDWPTQLKDIRVEECVRYFEAYCRYVLFTTEMIHRRTQRLDNVKRMHRSVQFQVEHAAATLDTELPAYREQATRLAGQETALQAGLDALVAEAASAAAQWAAVEEVLEALEVEFDPPTLLVQQLQRDLMASHVTAVDALTHSEQKLLDQEKRHVRNMQNLCTVTKGHLDERQATRASARRPDAPMAAAGSPSSAAKMLEYERDE